MFFLLIEHFHCMDIFSTISVKRKNSLHNILVQISVHTSMFLIHLSSTRSVNIMIIPTTMHFLYPCRAFRWATGPLGLFYWLSSCWVVYFVHGPLITHLNHSLSILQHSKLLFEIMLSIWYVTKLQNLFFFDNSPEIINLLTISDYVYLAMCLNCCRLKLLC